MSVRASHPHFRTVTYVNFPTRRRPDQPVAFIDVPVDVPGRPLSRAGTLWHLAHAGILRPETPLAAWTTRTGGLTTWHLTGGCVPDTIHTSRAATVGFVLDRVTDPDRTDLLCECERRTLIERLALDASSVSVLRFLINTDASPSTPEAARALRVRLRTRPPGSTTGRLDARADARAALRWRQLLDATGNRTFQAATCHQLVEQLRQRTDPLPSLWSEACATWYHAYRCDLDQVGSTGGSYETSHRAQVHDLVWEALTSRRIWVRGTPPADGVTELGCVFAEDEDHALLLIPAAAHQHAEFVCADRGFTADDVSIAAGLRPGAEPAEIENLASALTVARTL